MKDLFDLTREDISEIMEDYTGGVCVIPKRHGQIIASCYHTECKAFHPRCRMIDKGDYE